MRDFYKNILENLYIYCGNRQIDKMSDSDITELLDALENISKLFDYIPEEEQKAIIKRCLLSDKDYQNLNVRLIHRWLSENGKMYFKEEAHTPIQFYEPAPREVADKYIEQFKANLQKIGNKTIIPITDEEINQEGKEKPQGEKYIPDPRYAIEHANKITEFRRRTVRERHPELTDEEIEERIKNMPL